jgi:hypothetical protein
MKRQSETPMREPLLSAAGSAIDTPMATTLTIENKAFIPQEWGAKSPTKFVPAHKTSLI